MTKLIQEKCVPCKSDIPSMADDEIAKFLNDVPEWEVVNVKGIQHLKRKFKFKNFAEALTFTIKVGKIAEEEGHHPVIELTWGRVSIDWWTHTIEGLHKNDFIMAAKTSEIYEN